MSVSVCFCLLSLNSCFLPSLLSFFSHPSLPCLAYFVVLYIPAPHYLSTYILSYNTRIAKTVLSICLYICCTGAVSIDTFLLFRKSTSFAISQLLLLRLNSRAEPPLKDIYANISIHEYTIPHEGSVVFDSVRS